MARQAKVSPETWAEVQWTDLAGNPLTAANIAVQVGLPVANKTSLQLVQRWAKKLGKPLRAVTPGPKSRIDVDDVNWNRDTLELAKELECTPEWIRVLKKRHQSKGAIENV